MARYHGKGKGKGESRPLARRKEEVSMERNSRPKGARESEMGVRGAIMKPNSRVGSFIEEDWSEPALLKRGVHEFNLGNAMEGRKYAKGKIADLYEQVEKGEREDSIEFERQTSPTNW